jgi:hypothetical protein
MEVLKLTPLLVFLRAITKKAGLDMFAFVPPVTPHPLDNAGVLRMEKAKQEQQALLGSIISRSLRHFNTLLIARAEYLRTLEYRVRESGGSASDETMEKVGAALPRIAPIDFDHLGRVVIALSKSFDLFVMRH